MEGQNGPFSPANPEGKLFLAAGQTIFLRSVASLATAQAIKDFPTNAHFVEHCFNRRSSLNSLIYEALKIPFLSYNFANYLYGQTIKQIRTKFLLDILLIIPPSLGIFYTKPAKNGDCYAGQITLINRGNLQISQLSAIEEKK